MTGRDHDGPILEIENLSISFFTRLREIPAVMDFSCTVQPGEAMGLVGESGCGKSTVALVVMRDLGRSGRITGGTIRFKGRDLTTMGERDLRAIRGSQIAMIYQEPMASLNPAIRSGSCWRRIGFFCEPIFIPFMSMMSLPNQPPSTAAPV